jgi:hypothetical protein
MCNFAEIVTLSRALNFQHRSGKTFSVCSHIVRLLVLDPLFVLTLGLVFGVCVLERVLAKG